MERNPVFDLAAEFVNSTARPIFLTGKAGTGKTTFLKYIRESTRKKTVVVAPTGVAAINAGGVTMHSMFQLPFGPYLPVSQRFVTEGITDKHTLFKNLRISQEKRDIIRDLDLIIVDEVSMVRCDTLDAMDVILRYVRGKPNKPFGGIQILFIGDLFQLPPVMPEGEWTVLREYYEGPFFFHAKVIQQCRLVYLELKKIYRQNEQRFIDILNRVRNAEPTDDDLDLLNNRLNNELIAGKSYITLTSHNYKADKINQEELKKLPGKLFEFKGAVQGDFPEKVLPTDSTLQLKEGAQIMFIRNDNSEERKYFNGKIAVVKKIDENGVIVSFKDSTNEFLLEKDNWENIKYSYNQTAGQIDSEVIGSFSQYPVRLAWAITIHKSQGLTFENAIIDAGDSFAAGQVYVALSRCTSIDGLILHSTLTRRSISTDHRVLDFANTRQNFEDIQTVLEQEKEIFSNTQLLDTFDITRLKEIFQNHKRYIYDKVSENKIATDFSIVLVEKAHQLQNVSDKFSAELENLLKVKQIDNITDRVTKAIQYYVKFISDEIVGAMDNHVTSIKGGKKLSKYLKRIRNLRNEAISKIRSLQNVKYGDVVFTSDSGIVSVPDEPPMLKKTRPKKGDSIEETFKLINTGKTIDEICEIRGLVAGTIEGHLARLVGEGRVDILNVLTPERLAQIEYAINDSRTNAVMTLKEKLGKNFSFGEIRAAIAYLDLRANRE